MVWGKQGNAPCEIEVVCVLGQARECSMSNRGRGVVWGKQWNVLCEIEVGVWFGASKGMLHIKLW